MTTVIESGATLDPTGRYRYLLWRRIGHGEARVGFCMLNPSTADAAADDPTIRKCCGFAARWGFDIIEVVNLFAWRATDPRELKIRTAARVGPENDQHLLECVGRIRMLVCAWGNPGELAGRGRAVLRLLGDRPVYHLGLNGNGHPKHPLYRPYETPLESAWAAELARRVRC